MSETGMPAQIDVANELLRAALEVMTKATSGPYVQSVDHCMTKANGGGDGACVMQEIADYFDAYDVPREPQWPDETAA